MKRWMAFALIGLALAGVVRFAVREFEKKERAAELASEEAEAEKVAVHERAVEAGKRRYQEVMDGFAREQANKKLMEEQEAKAAAFTEDLRATMKRSLSPAEYEEYVRKSDTEAVLRKSQQIQEEQLKELREINEKIGK